MKNPKVALLVILTLLVIAFTAGMFCGRNYGGSPISLSIPEEIHMPAPTAQASSMNTPAPEQGLFPIDINSASLQELTALPGIGEGLAEDILAYRELNGSFSHVEELMNVPGIGPSRLEAILSLITAGGTQ